MPLKSGGELLYHTMLAGVEVLNDNIQSIKVSILFLIINKDFI